MCLAKQTGVEKRRVKVFKVSAASGRRREGGGRRTRRKEGLVDEDTKAG
jgi:hypothetical protein